MPLSFVFVLECGSEADALVLFVSSLALRVGVLECGSVVDAVVVLSLFLSFVFLFPVPYSLIKNERRVCE